MIKKFRRKNRTKKSYQIEVHVNEINKRGLERKVGLNSYHLSDPDDYPKLIEYFKALNNI